MQKDKVVRQQRQVAAVFFAASPLLLIVGVGLGWWKYRFYGRGQRRHSEANGHGQGTEAAHAADLPSR